MTFNGHGAAMLMIVSMIIATRTTISHLRYGRTSSNTNANMLLVDAPVVGEGALPEFSPEESFIADGYQR